MAASTLRRAVLAALACLGVASAAFADGSVFVTGHDPDFHGLLGGNFLGAQNINRTAIGYVMDPAFNPYVAGGANKFLFVESSISPPPGHTNGVNGIIASGYALGTNFDQVDAAGLNAALNQLGTAYSALVVASDFGGVLTQAELDILNARASDIHAFVNSGGGLYALAESNNGAHLTPNGGQFAYLPIVTSSVPADQAEVGFTVSPFGASLGLTDNDVNGNASHNIFTSIGGLTAVDYDGAGRIVSAAGRLSIPEPATVVLACCGGLLALRRR
jgi:hypothetical protein